MILYNEQEYKTETMKQTRNKIKSEDKSEEKISRKEAIVRVGKYAAFTAAATMFVLSPKKSQAASIPPTP